MEESILKSRRHHVTKSLFYGVVLLAAIITLSFIYLLSTSPFSSDTFIQPAFQTSYSNGQVFIKTNYTPRIYSGWLATVLGTYKQAVTIVWDRFKSPKAPPGDESQIATYLQNIRFNPSMPYLISGDQFDDLYLRNLSVFYQDLLQKNTTTNLTDYHNRERIAVQSLAYGLAALQQLHKPVTTLSPITPHGVLAFNVYSYPSDSMFSLFQMLVALKQNPDTAQVAAGLEQKYHSGLSSAYQNYLDTVKDPHTGLIKLSIHLSGARDAAVRESSFYDNVILWKTETLATNLGLDHISDQKLDDLRQTILDNYWDSSQGHFIDDVAPGHEHSYSSDWLIALPTGFLSPDNPDDLAKLKSISSYIDSKGLTSPLPIRYTVNDSTPENLFVKTFVGSYGTTAIWSYWGDLYIDLENDLYHETGTQGYDDRAAKAISEWSAVIKRDQGYPETLDQTGKLLITPVYESIRVNGWIVDFEAAQHKDSLDPNTTD